MDGRFRRWILASYWYRAGKELLKAGRPADARACFSRSTSYRFWNKAWLRLGWSRLHSA